jgi:hypothetical protein
MKGDKNSIDIDKTHDLNASPLSKLEAGIFLCSFLLS